jgi:cysteine-rich repeat protein
LSTTPRVAPRGGIMLRTIFVVLATAAVLPGTAAGADPIQSLLSPKTPCASMAAGDTCSFSLEGNSFPGICVALPTGKLACVPAPPPNYCPSPSICGNGIVEPGEECDPGTAGFTRECNINCTFSRCGDEIVNPAAGEECDRGSFNRDDADCTASCKVNVCGDGLVDQIGPNHIEQCDDGNTLNSDRCTNFCTLAYCGDGIRSDGEECDDGLLGSETCTSDCKLRTN